MDPLSLGAAVAAMLAPFTPYLVEGGKKFAGKAGEAAWEQVTAIWAKLTAHLGGDAKFRGTSLVLSADPQDPGARDAFAAFLSTAIGKNPALASDLAKLLGGSQQVVAASGQSTIEDVSQRTATRGAQTVTATDGSTVRGVKQHAE